MKFTPVLAGAAMTGAALLITAAPAAASGPIHFTGGSGCHSSTAAGAFACVFDFTGGTAPFSYSWATSSANAHVTSTTIVALSTSSYEITGRGTCTVGTTTLITLHLADSAGQTASVSSSLTC